MSPIDHELERALSARATGLVPPADLLDGVERQARGIRRRRAALSGAAALSVLAIAVSVPVALRDDAPGRDRDAVLPATAGPAPSTSPSASASAGARTFSDLGWPQRGPRGTDEDLLRRAHAALNATFEGTHGPDESAAKMLWAGPLPDGRLLAVFHTAEIRDGVEAQFANFYVESDGGERWVIEHRTAIVDRNPQGPAQGEQSQTRLPQVSSLIGGPEPVVVVVGAPTTGELEFSTDGRRYTSVDISDGAGVIAVTTGDDAKAYRVRLYDGDGVIVYDGPVDLVSED